MEKEKGVRFWQGDFETQEDYLLYITKWKVFFGEILDILALEDSNIQSQPGEKTRQLLTPRETES